MTMYKPSRADESGWFGSIEATLRKGKTEED
jgi:hypothetical protein